MATKMRGRPRKRAKLPPEDAEDAPPPPSAFDSTAPLLYAAVDEPLPPPQVAPADSDVSLLQDFCAYLELRVATKNLELLRRMATEFLARQEHTLAQFKCLGVNLVAVLPFARPDAHARAAQLLLHKPKPPLVDRACVFEFLFARVATKNMNLLKQMFLEFCVHDDTTICEFVKLGVAAVAVIPYEPAQFHYGGYMPPPPPYAVPAESYAQRRRGAADLGAHYPPPAAPVGQTPREAKTKHERAVVKVPKSSMLSPPLDKVHAAKTALNERAQAAVDVKTPLDSSSSSVSSSTKAMPTSSRTRIIRKPVRFCSDDDEGSEVFAAAMRKRKSALEASLEADDGRGEGRAAAARMPLAATTGLTPTPRVSASAETRRRVVSRKNALKKTTAHPNEPPKTTKTFDASHATELDGASDPSSPEASKAVHRAVCAKLAARPLKLQVIKKLQVVEAQRPWRRVFRDLPLPFDEVQAPALAEKLQMFWKIHGRAVWERNFWAPLSEDTHREQSHQRKGRQRLAQMMFETIIHDAYTAFGAELFVQLDTARHPGWWYRRPILDMCAYHALAGDARCWRFVDTQAFARFPECGMELPLKSPNYGVVRHSHSKRVSGAMWVTNASFVPQVLHEMHAIEQSNKSVDAKKTTHDDDDEEEEEEALLSMLFE